MPDGDTLLRKAAHATLKIPFQSTAQAEIAYKTLNVDQEPRRNFVTKELRLLGDAVEVHFTADQTKNLRTAITSFFESVLLCDDTIKSFDTDAGTHSSANTA